MYRTLSYKEGVYYSWTNWTRSGRWRHQVPPTGAIPLRDGEFDRDVVAHIPVGVDQRSRCEAGGRWRSGADVGTRVWRIWWGPGWHDEESLVTGKRHAVASEARRNALVVVWDPGRQPAFDASEGKHRSAKQLGAKQLGSVESARGAVETAWGVQTGTRKHSNHRLVTTPHGVVILTTNGDQLVPLLPLQ